MSMVDTSEWENEGRKDKDNNFSVTLKVTLVDPSVLLKLTGAPSGCTGGGPRRPPTSPNKASFHGGRPESSPHLLNYV